VAKGVRVPGSTHAHARVVVLFPASFDGWTLPPFEPTDDRAWISGGERTLLELAAAAAVAGRTVELRGSVAHAEVSEIEQAAGVVFERPYARRRADAGDTIIIPEGVVDPIVFARAALSPARAVVAVLGAPGLFGWAFDGHGRGADVLTVEPASVGRPEQLEAARHVALEVWTNLRAIASQAGSLGIPHHFVGVGRPLPYPEPGEKRFDVATLADNKWAPLAREAVRSLRPGISTTELPSSRREELLRGLGGARILIHPVRVEGRSRVAEEARAMGTVPITLSSNHLGEGMDASCGGVAVDSVAQIAPAVHGLLDAPERLTSLSAAGYRDARTVSDWPSFVGRVSRALECPDADLKRFAGGRAALGDALAEREQRLLDALSQAGARERALRSELSAAADLADVLSAALAESDARFTALRRRKIVRAGLSATRVLKLLRPRRAQS
jgi:hypothetical protein